MYHFNLLPVTAQKATRWWMIRAQLNLGFTLVNIAIIGLVGLFWQGNRLIEGIQVSADVELQQLQRIEVPESKAHTDVQSLNRSIQALRDIQESHPALLFDIQQVVALLGDGMTLTSIQLNYDDRVVALSGTADTRDSLEQLQDTIESQSNLTIADFPFAAFAQSNDIPFTITLTMTNAPG